MGKADETLDVIGYPCPLPIMKIINSLKQLESGQVLEVVSDMQDVVDDVKMACERTGDEMLECENDEGLYRICIKKV